MARGGLGQWQFGQVGVHGPLQGNRAAADVWLGARAPVGQLFAQGGAGACGGGRWEGAQGAHLLAQVG